MKVGSATNLVGSSGSNELVGELGLVGGVDDLDRRVMSVPCRWDEIRNELTWS